MLAARTPVLSTTGGFLSGARGVGVVLRCPEFASGEILQFGVRMTLLEPMKCRLQFLSFRSAERGGQSAGKNRPVRVTGWHLKFGSNALELLDEIGRAHV